jgi:hypothetical protein
VKKPKEGNMKNLSKTVFAFIAVLVLKNTAAVGQAVFAYSNAQRNATADEAVTFSPGSAGGWE